MHAYITHLNIQLGSVSLEQQFKLPLLCSTKLSSLISSLISSLTSFYLVRYEEICIICSIMYVYVAPVPEEGGHDTMSYGQLVRSDDTPRAKIMDTSYDLVTTGFLTGQNWLLWLTLQAKLLGCQSNTRYVTGGHFKPPNIFRKPYTPIMTSSIESFI